MIAFEQFHMEDGTPIYLQIVSFVQRGIVAGTIADGDEMPSRRVLSALIGVNPNTIQKAYRMLEEDGIIESRSGAKSYVTITESSIKRIRSALIQRHTKSNQKHETNGDFHGRGHRAGFQSMERGGVT